MHGSGMECVGPIVLVFLRDNHIQTVSTLVLTAVRSLRLRPATVHICTGECLMVRRKKTVTLFVPGLLPPIALFATIIVLHARHARRPVDSVARKPMESTIDQSLNIFVAGSVLFPEKHV